jgi:hypothetical protein
MGFAMSWIACNGKEPELLHQKLGCRSTGEFGEYADYPLVGRSLPSGWYAMVANRCDHRIVSEPVLSAISLDCSVIACSIEEHVMYCASSLWRDGGKIWGLVHQGDRDVADLTVTGNPPDTLIQIREDCAKKQAGEPRGRYPVDWFFEIPLELAGHAAGFRHDKETPGVESESFEIFQIAGDGLLANRAKPWWRPW